jgi:hypothetical protein
MFSEFGNSNQLKKILSFADFTKWHKRVQVSKSALQEDEQLDKIISSHSTDLNAKGKVLSTYKEIDWVAVSREYEDIIRAADIPDMNIKVKVVNQRERIGLAPFPTGKEEDRSLLFVTDVKPLCNRTTGNQFGWSVFTSSFGSGIQSRFSVKGKQYREWETNPIAPNDIIRCLGWEPDRGYFNLTAWKQIYV